jgi:hypothetical protein
LLVLNVEAMPMDGLAFVGKRETGPTSPFIFVISEQLDLIVGAMRIDDEKFFPVVALAVDKGDEQGAGFRTEDILENACFEIEFLFATVTGRILAIFKRAGVAAARSSASRFLDLIVSGVGEAKNRVAEVFAELVFLRKQLQHASLGGSRRIDHQIAIAVKNCAGHFAENW